MDDNLPDAARDRYEQEFRRTRMPHVTVVRRLAAETNQPINTVKDWFKAKRGNLAAPAVAPVAPAVAARAPAVAPRVLAVARRARAVAPVAPVMAPMAPAVALRAPAVAPMAPAVAPIAPAMPLRPGPVIRLQPNIQMSGSRIKCNYGENYQLDIILAHMEQIGDDGVVHVGEKINITLPKPDVCFSNGFVADLGQNQIGNGISAEEAMFIKVLRNKLKCDICIDGLITLRCAGCQKGICGECVVHLIVHSRNYNQDVNPYRRIQCPNCRKENNPFEALVYARF